MRGKVVGRKKTIPLSSLGYPQLTLGRTTFLITIKNYMVVGASLVAQWLRIHLPVQGTQVQALVLEDPTCVEQLSLCTTTTEPVCHNY